jgi:hypothetical protein
VFSPCDVRVWSTYFLSESKSVLRYSLKPKVGILDEHLLAEALEAISAPLAPMSLIGAITKPMSAPARDGVVSLPMYFRDEVCQPLLRRGFLLSSGAVLPLSEVGGSPLSSVQSVFGCPPLLSFSEVGESLRGCGFEEVGDFSGVAIDLSFCFQTMGVSHEGNVKGFLDLMAQVDVEQCQEASVSTSKFKGSCEVKNLECTINYDARGFGSSRGKARGPLL